MEEIQTSTNNNVEPLPLGGVKSEESVVPAAVAPTAPDAVVPSDGPVEVPKKKRQRRATPPAPTAVAAVVAAIPSLDTVDSSGVPPLSDVSCGVSSDGTSVLPDGSNLLPNADQFGGAEVPISTTSAARKFRSNYDADGVEIVEGNLSKAATRMRKYRADHRNDHTWLAKEAERMRNMRAARKLGLKDNKEDKPKKERVGRRKKEKHVLLSELAPAEKFNHEEYLRKEAERVRKYRALKQLDPEWRKNDSDRMRIYRAKRKLDSGAKADVKSDIVSEEVPVPTDIELALASVPAHMLLQSAADVINEDTDSEDEAVV